VSILIRVNNLIKKYGEKTALKGISFKVNQGEIFGFLGPNGAGKTTTIKILTGQLLFNSGKASIYGKDVHRDKETIRPLIGVVPEETNLYERLTVKQNLEFFCRLYGCDLNIIHEYLQMINLVNERDTRVRKLSKGMKQKVLLIRALLHQPEVLFLDEPTSGLDPSAANNIHSLLQDLNQKGMTIFLTSHNMEEVDRLCHRVAFLDCGSIVATGSPDELKLKYSSGQVKVLIKNDQSLEEMTLNLNTRESGRLIEEWISQDRLMSIHSCEPSLADIFVKVTGRDI
jgi:ABC-2 type transport system ATP-binding protein